MYRTTEHIIIGMLLFITMMSIPGFFISYTTERDSISFRLDQVEKIEISYLEDYGQCKLDLQKAEEMFETKKSLCPDVKCDCGKGQYFLSMLWTITGIFLLVFGTYYHHLISKKSDALKEEIARKVSYKNHLTRQCNILRKRQLRLERLNNKVRK